MYVYFSLTLKKQPKQANKQMKRERKKFGKIYSQPFPQPKHGKQLICSVLQYAYRTECIPNKSR